MKKKATFDTKLRSVILALTSGILTNTLSAQVFPNSYVGNYDDNVLQLRQVSDLNSWLKTISIFAVFFLIWAVLSILLSLTGKIILRNRYWNKPRYTRRQLVKAYIDVKNRVKLLTLDLQECDDKNRLMLYLTDIIECTHSLYTHFCPKAMPAERNIYAAFRNSESIANVGMYVSPYEFNACLALLNDLLNKVYDEEAATGSPKLDVEKAKDELCELESMINKVSLREKHGTP